MVTSNFAGEKDMICPFCEQEMITGIMSGDGRSPVRWAPLDGKLSLMEKIVGKGIVTGVTYKFGFKIETEYCPHCKKMIFNTDVTK